jgi:hypothetical protein
MIRSCARGGLLIAAGVTTAAQSAVMLTVQKEEPEESFLYIRAAGLLSLVLVALGVALLISA